MGLCGNFTSYFPGFLQNTCTSFLWYSAGLTITNTNTMRKRTIKINKVVVSRSTVRSTTPEQIHMSRPCSCMTTSIVKDDKKTKAVIKQGEAQTCVSMKSVNGVKYCITEGDTLGKGRGRGQGVNYLKLR